jgi:hypothetical protein
VANISHQLKIITYSSQESLDKNTIKSSSPIITDQNMELQPMSASFKKTLHVSYTFLLIISLLITDLFYQ